MPTSTNVTNLKINELTEAQYDAAVQGGVIGENELSVITDMDIDAIQVSTMPTAAVGELDKIYQFIGTTDANYTNGYFYKCVSDGQNPATYSWTQTNVQPQAGGLPSQTGQSGKFLTTDGTNASWSSEPLTNKFNPAYGIFVLGSGTTGTNSVAFGAQMSSGSSDGVAIGWNASLSAANSVLIGKQASCNKLESTVCGYKASSTAFYATSLGGESSVSANGGTALGYKSHVTASYAIQLGYGTNSEANTLYAGWFYQDNAVNYKLLDSDGTIPAARHATLPAADGTYVLKLVIASGVPTLSWVAE